MLVSKGADDVHVPHTRHRTLRATKLLEVFSTVLGWFGRTLTAAAEVTLSLMSWDRCGAQGLVGL
jgi:hypothetical protein